jgi:hypothetical protein
MAGSSLLPRSGLVQWELCRYRHNAHSTGHPKRLNRDSIAEAAPFGSSVYAGEEPIAGAFSGVSLRRSGNLAGGNRKRSCLYSGLAEVMASSPLGE